MNALILCAGRGTRLQADIGNQPKPTIRFGDSSLLQRLLNQVALSDEISNIYINLSSGARAIVQDLNSSIYFPRLNFLYEREPWGPSLTVFELLRQSNNGLLVIHGDLLLESGSIGEFLTAITTLGCKESLLAVHKRDLNNTNQIIEVDELGLVKNIFWRESSEVFLEVAKRNQVGMVDVDSGIYYFSNLASNVLKTPCNTVGVSEGLLPQLIRNNMLRAVPWNGLRFAIDTGEKLKIARNAFINHPGKF